METTQGTVLVTEVVVRVTTVRNVVGTINITARNTYNPNKVLRGAAEINNVACPATHHSEV